MTARPIFPESRRMPLQVAVALCVVMMAVLLVAGCTTVPIPGNMTGTPTQIPIPPTKEKSQPFYKVTIAQKEVIDPDYVKMDSDVYVQGEVIEFNVVNEGSGSLNCWLIEPSNNFHLYRQIGTWELQPESEPRGGHTDSGYHLQPGESTSLRHLNTADLPPGHYKIVTECGVSREFEIRAAPGVTQ